MSQAVSADTMVRFHKHVAQHMTEYTVSCAPLPSYTDEQLGEKDALLDVMERLLVIKPTFWLSLGIDEKVVGIRYATQEAQRKALKPLVTLLNKGHVPTILDLHDALPLIISPDDMRREAVQAILALLLAMPGQASVCQAIMDHRTTCVQQGLEFTLFMVETPDHGMWRALSGGFDPKSGRRTSYLQLGLVNRLGKTLSELLGLQTYTLGEFMPTTDQWRMLHVTLCKRHCKTCLKRNVGTKCGKCGVAYYCDAGCQAADWKRGNHKMTCLIDRALNMYICAEIDVHDM